MNRTLLDPFQAVQLPEVIEEYLEHGATRCIALNSRGTLCAAGCADGKVVIWDMETRGVARVIHPHSAAVSSLAWSRDGRQLLSGSADGCVSWWNMEAGAQLYKVDLGRPVLRICIQRRQPHCCLVSFVTGKPTLVTVPPQQQQQQQRGGDRVPQGEQQKQEQQQQQEPEVTPVPTLVIEGEGKSGNANPKPNDNATAVAAFSADGSLLYVGQTRGTLLVLDRDSLDVLDIIRVSGSPRITHLLLNRRGTHLLVNCNDRVIRLFEARTKPRGEAPRRRYALQDIRSRVAVMKLPKQGSLLHPHDPMLVKAREFHNAVERMNWKAFTFSADSEYVVAAPDCKADHTLYIWSRVWGKLERILEGPREGLVDLQAHPLHSTLLSVSTNGRIYIWSTVYRENWSAFAPDFEELEENQEYIEREDEFDLNPRPDQEGATAGGRGGSGEQPSTASGGDPDEEADVDVVGVDEMPVLSSDEEGDAEGLYYLPVEVIPEGGQEGEDDKGQQQQHEGKGQEAAANGGGGGGGVGATRVGGALGKEVQRDQHGTGGDGPPAKKQRV